MKRKILIFIIILVFFIGALTIFSKPFILFLAKRQLEKTFKGSLVSIGSCTFKPISLLYFSDIEIKNKPTYEIIIKEAGANYNLSSLLKMTVLRAYAKDTVVDVNLKQKSAFNLIRQYLEESAKGKGKFLIKDVRISNLKMNLRSADLSILATASLGLNPIEQLINSLDLKVSSSDILGFHLEDAYLKTKQKESEGEFYIGEAKYNKLKVRQIKSSAKLEDKVLSLDSLSGQILDGRLQGDLTLKLDKNIEYLFKTKFIDLDLETYVKDFELGEKFMITGKLGGLAILEGRGTKFNIINGDLDTSEAGGTFIIKDKKFLENLARTTKQSLDILVDSFKDYHYNTGKVNLLLDKGDLVVDVALDGNKGKRNLTIVLHDFKLGKEE